MYIKYKKINFFTHVKKAYNSVGRVPVLQTGCHRFESGWAYKIKYSINGTFQKFDSQNWKFSNLQILLFFFLIVKKTVRYFIIFKTKKIVNNP